MTIEENFKFREKIIKARFKESVGYELNLDNPKTFNEKLQWLKFYYHDPLVTKCSDKYLAREYIKEVVGEEYLIPLLGVWDTPDDIDFDSLPNQFALKVNWGSGMNIIVSDKTNLDINETKKILNKWMNPVYNHYYLYYEWQYKFIKPKIICEKYFKDDKTENLIVYGVYCFNNEPKYIHTITDAHTGNDRLNMYDTDWNKLNMRYIFDNPNYDIERPLHLELMLDLAKKLSKPFNHVRVDFFVVNEKLYFAELTFHTSCGVDPFYPKEWDYKFGELINLPESKKIDYDFIDREELLNQIYNLEPIIKNYRDIDKELTVYKDKYKECEIKYKNSKKNTFALLGFINEKEYFTLIIFGLKIIFRKKSKK